MKCGVTKLCTARFTKRVFTRQWVVVPKVFPSVQLLHCFLCGEG